MNAKTDPGFHFVEEDELSNVTEKRADRAFFIMHATRPGVHEWTREFEYAFYPPLTQANSQFELMILKWPKELMGHAEGVWFVVVVPLADAPQLIKLGAKWRLTFVNEGVPMFISSKEIEPFPLKGRKNVWTVEGGYLGSHYSPPVKKRR